MPGKETIISLSLLLIAKMIIIIAKLYIVLNPSKYNAPRRVQISIFLNHIDKLKDINRILLKCTKIVSKKNTNKE